jgi:chaperonin GroEL
MNNKFARKVVYGKEYEEAKLRGSNLSKLVAKSAYGVGAGNVMIERNFGAPLTSRDGVSNLEQLHVAEPVENMVIQSIVQSSQRTNQHAGDGTTATAILASDLYEQGVKDIHETGRSPIQVANKILETSREVYKFIDSKKVKATKKDLKNIARISSHDTALGDMVSFIFEKFDGDGGVVVGTHDGDDTTMSMEEGFYFKKGFADPKLISHPGLRESYLTNVPVLVISKVLKTSNDMIAIFEKIGEYAANHGRIPLDFLMIADIEGVALEGLKENPRNLLIPTVVTPLDHGARKDAFFQDVATYTGGKVISNNDFDDSYFGNADEVIASGLTTNIIYGTLDLKKLEELHDKGKISDADFEAKKKRLEGITFLLNKLDEQIEKTTDSYDLEFLNERKNRLQGKIATISVGGETEQIRIEKKLRVDDASNAVRSAKLYGIVPGEGEPLLWAASVVNNADRYGNLFLYLLENCGIDDPDSYAYKLVDECKFGEGYDISGDSLPEGADRKTVINLREHGIVDPVQVVLETVRNAAAVAALLVTSTTGMYYENRDIKQD